VRAWRHPTPLLLTGIGTPSEHLTQRPDRGSLRLRGPWRQLRLTTVPWGLALDLGVAAMAGVEVTGADVVGVIPAGVAGEAGVGVDGVGVLAGAGALVGDGVGGRIPSGTGHRTHITRGGTTTILLTVTRILSRILSEVEA
jgi:hypothetical protein